MTAVGQILNPRDNRYLGSREGTPPTGDELGAVVQAGVTPWAAFAYDELEHVPELQFPASIRTYAAMRSDAQVDGLLRGCTWPIYRYKWMIDPNECSVDRVRKLAADLNLPVKGDPPTTAKPRTKKRFIFHNHLMDALRSLTYGFYCFEQVGFIGDDGLWHLRKLAARPPITIQDIILASDGMLSYVIQNISAQGASLGQPARSGTPYSMPEIPVDRLVWYAWDQEGANWQGRSMLRSIYRNWLIKDRLLRVDAIKHERNGMGVPHATGSQGMTDPELKKLAALAQKYKAGDTSGLAFPYGATLELLGVKGTLPDTWASINGHNEEMARAFLMMFLQLGQTLHGSRALGKEFVDYFQLAQEFIANWFMLVFTEHVIEDYWDWNYGDSEETTPQLAYERDDDPRFAAADLAVLIQNGAIQVDDEIEEAVREAMELPAFDPNAKRTYLEPPPQPSAPGVGDQPGQPSTQPGNSDPAFPDQNPDVKAAGGTGVPGQPTSPARPGRPHLRAKVVVE